MRRRRRRLLWSAGIAAGLLAAAVAAGILALRSQWFLAKLHDNVIQVVETATGGRAEMGAIQFDWHSLRARVAGFTLHGTEGAGKPPLFQAGSLGIAIKVVSIFRRQIDLQELEVKDPRIYLIVGPNGRTNIPGPKTAPGKPALDTILDLAVGRFQVDNGAFQVEGQAPQPFSARGENLNARFVYDRTGPRYRGDLAVDLAQIRWPGLTNVPAASLTTSFVVERNRIQVASGRVRTAGSEVSFSGAVDNLADPMAKFQVDGRMSAVEGARLVRIPEVRGGAMHVTGSLTWSRPAGASLAGDLHATGMLYQDASVRLREFRVDGALSANARGVDLRGARVAGLCTITRATPQAADLPVEARIARATLRGRDVDLEGIALSALDGRFEGRTLLGNFRDYHVEGQVAGFRARRVMALYSTEATPWDALVSGSLELNGQLGRGDQFRAAGEWEIEPVPDGAPVRGHLTARYEAAGGVLDLGRSTLSLPGSRMEFSGALGSVLRVHLETRDFAELLPAVGKKAASLPVKLENGTAVFDGTVTGNLNQPRAAGHLRVTNLAYDGRRLDALEGDVTASAEAAGVTKGSVAAGSLRAQFHGELGLAEWEAGDGSALKGSGTLSPGSLADALALAHIPAEEAAGTLSGTVEVSGTIGNPLLAGDLTVTRGVFRDEPFDRLAAQFHSAGNRIEVNSAQLTAGSRQARLTAAFDHVAGQFDSGRIRFQASTNGMPLDEFRTLEATRPGVRGSVTVTAGGEVVVRGSEVRLNDLNAQVEGRGLQLTGQTLGDATLTAHSEGQVLRAHLESNFADSHISGDGEWRLEGDDPGSATLNFSKLDFAQLRPWFAPAQAEGKTPAEPPLAGFAEGQLRVDGPLMQRAEWRAELRIPSFQIRASESNAAPGVNVTLTNAEPIVAHMAKSVVTVDSARLKGRATDLSITGTVALGQKNPLDLRVNGDVDLAILHDLDRDFASSGKLATDATVRGDLDDPQIAGRVQFSDAAFSLADFPNGISKANGVILFTKDRATIQSFSGETGGGKVDLSGFASYTGGLIIYRLHARAEQVRVRYPEGVSTVANASLSLTGTRDQSMLSGTVTVLRTGFNPQGDFSSLITHSAEPVRTPAARTGLLGGMSFGIQINTAPDTEIQSSLTQDLQVEANLTLRGSPSNPALLGRITITQGRVVFYGTKFNVNEGSISFFNPLKIDPILDIDLETKARGIDVTLTVSGPLTHPNLTPHSDPPLQFSEIVALLATGEAPSSDPTLLAQQSTTPQSWQQMGASALLGQAIASPVQGRLQRFFGVSKLRIDPTLPGVENNPQARLTLEQQVTSQITFTYITNVTTSNPQVVRVEWALSKQWSVVALREENGVFGIDFYLKKRF